MRKRAEKILTDIAAAHNAELSETGSFPMGVTVEAVDILEVELTAAVKEEREKWVARSHDFAIAFTILLGEIDKAEDGRLVVTEALLQRCRDALAKLTEEK